MSAEMVSIPLSFSARREEVDTLSALDSNIVVEVKDFDDLSDSVNKRVVTQTSELGFLSRVSKQVKRFKNLRASRSALRADKR